MNKLLDTYDADALRRLCEEEGLLQILAERGFRDFDVTVAGNGLPSVRLSGSKNNRRWPLLEASLTEYVVQPELFCTGGYEMTRPITLAFTYWLREEDPTASFVVKRPPLPLQRHPGLGVLRRAFHVLARIARDRNLDGVACVPKFFHDAAIFYRSRLFLFLAGEEQGRFEALLRDLDALSLATATIKLVTGQIRDANGEQALWSPGLQVCPLSPLLTAYFHSPHYAAQVQAAYQRNRFVDTGA